MAVQVTLSGRRAVVALLVVGVLGLAASGARGLLAEPFGGRIRTDRYQAVVLRNDRVYIGRLHEAGRHFYELREAYFITTRSVGDGEAAQQVPEVKPIGEELTGPERDLLIGRPEIVTVTNLRPDSQVVAAIERLRRMP